MAMSRNMQIWLLAVVLTAVFPSASASAALGSKRVRAGATRGPAAVDNQMEKLFGESENFSIAGRPYKLLKKKNSRGAVVEQILMTRDRIEISSDPRGTGSLQSWQLITPDRVVYMHEPDRGRFMFMEVVEKKPRALLTMKFVAKSTGEYALYAANAQPYKVQHNSIDYTDFVVGCRATEKELQMTAAQVNDIVTKTPNALKDNIQSKIMNPSCTDPNSPFKGESLDAITEGIMKVMNSDPSWNSAQKVNDAQKLTADQRTVESKGSFLQCMRYYQLDTHASRIESAFASYIDQLSDKNKFYWKIDCKNEPKGDDTGSYTNPANSAPIISFTKIAQDMLKYPPKGVDSADSYAQTFFHEMIHYSLIKDENIVGAIENCCSPTGDQKQCSKLAQITQNKVFGQQIENQVAKALGDKYPDFRSLLDRAYGNNADEVMSGFYAKAGETYSKYYNTPGCRDSIDGRGLTSACETQFKQELKKVADQNFGTGPDSECTKATSRSAWAKAGEYVGIASKGSSNSEALNNMSSSQAQKFCAALSSFSDEVFFNANTSQMNCACKQSKTAAVESGNYKSLWWLTSPRLARADGENSAEDFVCQMCQMQPKQPISYEYSNQDLGYTGDNPASPRHTSTPNDTNDGTGQASNSPISKPSSGRDIGYQNPTSQGPRRPDYSSTTPSEREQAIARMVDRQDSVFGPKLAQLSDRLLKPSIPEARAQETSSRNSNSQQSLTLVKMQTPAATLPSPLNQVNPGFNARALSGGGQQGNSSPGAQGGGSAQASGADRAMASASGVASGGLGGGRGVAGGTGGAAGNAGSAKTAGGSASGAAGAASRDRVGGNVPKKKSPADERAMHALLAYLQRSFDLVRPELQKPSVINALKRHEIQVIDDEGAVFGSGFPQFTLIYNQEKNRLVPKSGGKGK